jgi:hypothetical protein
MWRQDGKTYKNVGVWVDCDGLFGVILRQRVSDCCCSCARVQTKLGMKWNTLHYLKCRENTWLISSINFSGDNGCLCSS